jgi:hypothetical protein
VAAERRRRAGRILIGIGVMIILAALPFLILSRYAGDWGVPYFSWTTVRGSVCTNDIAGYHCDDLTVADINWYGDLDLPSSSTVLSAHYKSTHDFELEAIVEVPESDAKDTVAGLDDTFGGCVDNHPTRLDTDGLDGVCVRANDASDSTESDAPLADTLYEVTTGAQKDGTLMVTVYEKSR